MASYFRLDSFSLERLSAKGDMNARKVLNSRKVNQARAAIEFGMKSESFDFIDKTRLNKITR